MADQPNVNINDDKMTTNYANAFRQHVNQHEVMVDLGVNIATKDADGQIEMQFNVENRLVMNYVTAKRMAGMLVQVIQAHEKQFGEIKMG